MQTIWLTLTSIWRNCHNLNHAIPRKLTGFISALILLIYILELATGTFHDYTAFSIACICIDIIALGIFIYAPYFGSALVIALWIFAICIPQSLPYSFAVAGMFATVMLGYISLSSALGVALITFCCLIGNPYIGKQWLALYIATFVGLAGIGYVLRLIYDRNRTASRLAARQRQEAIAEELHDIVCNDLTYALHQIDLLADTADAPHEQADTRNDILDILPSIKDSVAEALQYARASITTLQSDGGNDAPGGNPINVNINSMLHRQQEKLAAAGFNGVVLADNIGTLPMLPEQAAIMDKLIMELFGNILKHADPAGGYVVTAHASASALHISVSDTPAESSAPAKPSASATTGKASRDGHRDDAVSPGGHGLRYYCNRLSAAGGSLSVSTADDQWTIDITVPLYTPDDKPNEGGTDN